jgi:hypothetical protein
MQVTHYKETPDINTLLTADAQKVVRPQRDAGQLISIRKRRLHQLRKWHLHRSLTLLLGVIIVVAIDSRSQ